MSDANRTGTTDFDCPGVHSNKRAAIKLTKICADRKWGLQGVQTFSLFSAALEARK